MGAVEVTFAAPPPRRFTQVFQGDDVLTELHIENLGVIATLDLVLGDGLTVLSGETGAGKTMLVEAINLLVGGRADGTLVRPGSAEARVEGRFVVGDDELVLARVIPADGRSRAYVNGRLATVTILAEEGVRLVDLHGQHAHQSLLGAAAQRSALDHFAKIDLSPLRSARATLTEVEALQAALGGDERARAREMDLIRFQVAELESATLDDPEEEAQLEATETLLAGALEHREAAERALAALVDDGAALDSLGAAIAALSHREPFEGEITRLRALVNEMTDAAGELRRRAESIDEDPERLASVRARRQQLRDLSRKYGATVTEMLTYYAETCARLDELTDLEHRAAGLDAERAAAQQRLHEVETAVGTARRLGAPELARLVAEHLQELAMAKARIDVTVGSDPGDEVTFLLGANAGEPSLPLARVASGGELARAMLALRLVLTEAPDTLVFDEVDAGVGGSAALAVGAALARLGARHQVLCVTHLPQVASQADHQIVVSKSVIDGRTFAAAETVTGDRRIDEISRMLAGRADSDAARRHAEELISAAESAKSR